MEQPPSPQLGASAIQKHPWMIMATLGIVNLSIGYFFGHRYRPSERSKQN